MGEPVGGRIASMATASGNIGGGPAYNNTGLYPRGKLGCCDVGCIVMLIALLVAVLLIGAWWSIWR